MSTIGFNKLRYEDDVNKLIDKLNKNFQALEFLLANGNLDGVNMKDSYIENLTVKAANIVGSLVVGENVDIGDTLDPISSAVQEKKRVFVVQPTPPYDVGDLWTTEEDMLVCNTAKDSEGSYSLTDWAKATNYTNPTNVTTIIGNTVTTGFLNAVGISANAITTGTMNASRIRGGTISGVTIDITTDATIGQWLTLSGTEWMAGIRWMEGATKRAEIYIDPMSGAMFLSSGEGIYANRYRIDQASTAKFG